MKRFTHIAFLFTCFLFSYPVFAQQSDAFGTFRIHAPYKSVIDSLQAVLKTQNNDTNKVNTLNRLSNKHEMLGNYDSALLYAESAQTLAEKISFKRGVANALRNIGFIYYLLSNNQKALEYQYKAFTIYQSIGNKGGITGTLNNIAAIYYKLSNYSKVLEYDFKVLTIAQQAKDTNTIAEVFGNIGIIYGEQGNYPKALEYFFKSLEMHRKIGNKDAIAINLGNIGCSYLAWGDYPKALEYSFKAITQAQEVGDKYAIANFLGDIGNIYYQEGDYIQALKYNFKAVTIARGIGDIDNISNIYSNTGGAYTKLKNYKQAKTFLDSALYFSEKTGNKKYIKITYSNLAVLDSATGNYKTAYSDYKKYMIYRDSILNQGTARIEISYEFEKREDSLKAEYKQENIIKTAETKRKKIINDGAIALLALTILLALSVINRQQVKRKKDKIIFEKERQQMENELSNAKSILDDYVKNMVEKNRLIEQFMVDIEELKEEIDEKRMENLKHLNKTTILTDEDWNKFKELFEQVYKGFFIRLKEKLPNLTQSEIRLICLTKLNLSTKQIGAILGLSLVTIKTSRYRLRKKLNLSGKDGLNRIVDYI